MSGNVTVQVTGGQPKVTNARTVQEAFNEMRLSGNYSATINGQPASMGDSLPAYAFVTFSPSVKGGNK